MLLEKNKNIYNQLIYDLKFLIRDGGIGGNGGGSTSGNSTR